VQVCGWVGNGPKGQEVTRQVQEGLKGLGFKALLAVLKVDLHTKSDRG
jgi:hypothetical protein